jgi:hypothetical protein
MTSRATIRLGVTSDIRERFAIHSEGEEMADDTSKKGLADRSRINVNERWELDYWTNELGVSADELRELVKKHGVMAADIRSALQGTKPPARNFCEVRARVMVRKSLAELVRALGSETPTADTPRNR